MTSCCTAFTMQVLDLSPELRCHAPLSPSSNGVGGSLANCMTCVQFAQCAWSDGCMPSNAVRPVAIAERAQTMQRCPPCRSSFPKSQLQCAGSAPEQLGLSCGSPWPAALPRAASCVSALPPSQAVHLQGSTGHQEGATVRTWSGVVPQEASGSHDARPMPVQAPAHPSSHDAAVEFPLLMILPHLWRHRLQACVGQQRTPAKSQILHMCTTAVLKRVAPKQMPVQARISAFATMSMQRASSSGSSGQGSGQGNLFRRLPTSDYGATSPQVACSNVRTCSCILRHHYLQTQHVGYTLCRLVLYKTPEHNACRHVSYAIT